jgi:hypothetical protein
MGKDDSSKRLAARLQQLKDDCVVLRSECQVCHKLRFSTLCIYRPCHTKTHRALCYECLSMHYTRHDLCGDKVTGLHKGTWGQVELDHEWAELAMRFYGKPRTSKEG